MRICVNYSHGLCQCKDDGGAISDLPAHTCVYCKSGIYAICARALTINEQQSYAPDKDIEGYGSHRVCHGCGLVNREQRLVASGAMILPEDGVAESGNFGVVRANIRATENNKASPRLVAPSADSGHWVDAFMEAVFDSDEDSDDYVRDDDDSSSRTRTMYQIGMKCAFDTKM